MTALAWEGRALTRSLRGAERRSLQHAQRAMDAALAILERGEELTTAKVAAHAGMSLKTLYRYFESKDDLLLAVYESQTRRAADRLRARIDPVDDPVEAIRAGVEELFTMSWRANRTAITAIDGHWPLSRKRPEELAASRAPLIDLFDELITRAVASGRARADAGRADATLVVSLVLTRLHVNAHRFDQPIDRDEVDALTAFCLSALGAQSATMRSSVSSGRSPARRSSQ